MATTQSVRRRMAPVSIGADQRMGGRECRKHPAICKPPVAASLCRGACRGTAAERCGYKESKSIFWRSVAEFGNAVPAMKLRALFIFAAANLFASPAFAQLTATDVQTIIKRAVTRAVK